MVLVLMAEHHREPDSRRGLSSRRACAHSVSSKLLVDRAPGGRVSASTQQKQGAPAGRLCFIITA